jgi:hypothetical protein
MSSRQKRKQRQRAAPGQPGPPSRSEQKNAEARAALEPLGPDERPGPVTAGALVAATLGFLNLGLYVAGFEIDGERPQIVGVLAFSALMLTAAWGMWNVRYWAVLGMQALLGLIIVVFSLFALTAASIWALLLALGVVGAAGALFWFMIRAMARIQMPTRD